MADLRIPPAIIFGAAAGAQHVLSRRRSPTRQSALLALPPFLASGWLVSGSLLEFFRQRTSVDPVKVSSARTLVRTGPNRLSRNPMYTGLAGVLVAHACLRRSGSSLLPVAAFIAYIDRFQIRAEESALTEMFGAEYEHYRDEVPRWLGIGSCPGRR
ncbi:methyltransferase family protein [Corynebacterium guangdongense]|uniref:Protein-S-isoprenylcysteine O-methyltransferase Ste14 n=1 Tax=Corynebacterium guangdongense TaxID=1783348 RepID=A0ABU1ZU44_9CORY|nr:isoprenylcysteine carboxylmethyltransferase family protein [Corynebacterium guangdongense]MDR7328390.1 protein-S-isoprenylcysteine O-methyltransferase Ste14 [Corynebacterium guangdongense]WJZ16967.1 hypothetical protein CGUA_01835 [Corynebacterium guangdongense]